MNPNSANQTFLKTPLIQAISIVLVGLLLIGDPLWASGLSASFERDPVHPISLMITSVNFAVEAVSAPPNFEPSLSHHVRAMVDRLGGAAIHKTLWRFRTWGIFASAIAAPVVARADNGNASTYLGLNWLYWLGGGAIVVLAIVAAGTIWYFSPYQKVRRSFGLSAGESLPSGYTEIIRQYGPHPFLTIAAASGENRVFVCFVGLPFVQSLIKNVDDLHHYGQAVIDMAQQAGNSQDMVAKGLSMLRDRITDPASYRAYASALIDVAPAAQGHLSLMIEMGLKPVQSQLNKPSDLRPLLIRGMRLSLKNANQNIRRLEERLSQLPEPVTEIIHHDEEEYYDNYGTNITQPAWDEPIIHDPVKEERGRINWELADLSNVKKSLPRYIKALEKLNSVQHDASSTAPRIDKEVSPIVLTARAVKFLDFLRAHELGDVTLFGGAVRDSALGREIRDLDVILAVSLSPKEKTRHNDPIAWNRVLGPRIMPRLERLAQALNVSVKDLLRGKARFQGVPVHYAGPYEITDHVGGSVQKRYARFGTVISADDNRMYSLDPMLSIHSFGVMPDGRWVGELHGVDDLKAKVLRTLNPIPPLPPDMSVRYLLLKHRLGFTLSPEIEQAIEAFSAHAHEDVGAFLQEAGNYELFQPWLADLISVAEPEALLSELNHYKLTDLFLQTQGKGSQALKALIGSRNPPGDSSGGTPAVGTFAQVEAAVLSIAQRLLNFLTDVHDPEVEAQAFSEEDARNGVRPLILAVGAPSPQSYVAAAQRWALYKRCCLYGPKRF